MAVRSVRTMDESFHKMLDEETRPVPASYRRDSPIEPGPTHVPVDRYFSKAFFDLEVEKVWKRVWQMAAHEDDLPNVGDYLPYDIAGLSFLIVKTDEDQYKAYYNACLHRGRKLREHRGSQADELRCPFHGWAWKIDGTLKQIPCQWDYPDLKRDEQSLPEAKVGRWGRYIFINPDPDCEPFEDWLGDLPTHFQLLPYEKRYKSAHVAKIIRCNWKVASEAFMESYHVIATHPQILMGGAHDVDTKYDVFGNYSRAIRCGALDSAGMPQWEPLPEDGKQRLRHPLNGFVYEREAEDSDVVVVTAPDGRSGRFNVKAQYLGGDLTEVNPHLVNWVGGPQLPETNLDKALKDKMNKMAGEKVNIRVAMADMQRDAYRQTNPSIAEDIADIEFASIFFTLFPNFHPWGSFNKINYRFRPNGTNPEECIMECIYLDPIPEDGDYEPVREIHWLGPDDDWTLAPELGRLAKVFNQDIRNLPLVQEGLHATAKDYVQLADYNETKPRHFQMMLEEWINRP